MVPKSVKSLVINANWNFDFLTGMSLEPDMVRLGFLLCRSGVTVILQGVSEFHRLDKVISEHRLFHEANCPMHSISQPGCMNIRLALVVARLRIT